MGAFGSHCAEAVAVTKQDKAMFTALLEQALAVDPDAVPASRLLNLVAQRRARPRDLRSPHPRQRRLVSERGCRHERADRVRVSLARHDLPYRERESTR